MNKYVICRPEGGLNDILCQITKCIKYCEKTNRILIIDTVSSSTFKIEFDVFFKTRNKNIILSNAKEISDNLLCQSSSIFPKINDLNIKNLKPKWNKLSNYNLNNNKLTFDFEKDYDEIVLLHHQCGGGSISEDFFRSFYLNNSICDMLFDRINKLPINYTGFHFRGTDMCGDSELAFSLLQEINGPIFLASDSYSFIQNAKLKLGEEKIFTFSQIPNCKEKPIHHNYNHISLDTKKQLNFDCILDLIILSLSKKIINPKTNSGFTRLAKNLNRMIDISFFETISPRLVEFLNQKNKYINMYLKRSDIINILIENMGYESYLEIGTQNPERNFDLIEAQNKVCVEPRPIPNTKHLISFIGTSDQYFESISEDVKFDIIFIDGLHQEDQVTRGINNSLKHLNDNGTIICHDCLPTKEELQYHEPHNNPKISWYGTTWKSIARLRIESTNLDIKTVNSDEGCAIIRFGKNIPYQGPDGDPYTYSYYEKNKSDLMNIISTKEFLSYVDQIKII